MNWLTPPAPGLPPRLSVYGLWLVDNGNSSAFEAVSPFPFPSSSDAVRENPSAVFLSSLSFGTSKRVSGLKRRSELLSYPVSLIFASSVWWRGLSAGYYMASLLSCAILAIIACYSSISSWVLSSLNPTFLRLSLVGASGSPSGSSPLPSTIRLLFER